MKSNRLILFLALVAVVVLVTSCSQFTNPTPTPQPVPVLLPTITPILIIMPSPTNAQIPTVTRVATLAPVSSASSSTSSSSVATATPNTPQVNRISFPTGGTTASLAGTVAGNGIDRYVLRVLAGQSMTVNFAPVADNVTIQISGADGNVLVSGGAKFTTGTFPLTVTQDYFISIISSRNTATNYTLQITIPPLGQEASTPTPKRITFAAGGTSATVQGALSKNGMDRWIIRVQAGQTMTAKAIAQNGNVMLIVFGVDGDVYQTDHVGSPDFSSQMRTTQDYYIDVRAWGDTAPSYTLQITIPPK